MATSTMDWDMEVDDAVVADPIDTTQTQTEVPQIPAAYYESLVDEPSSALSKVHIRGIDILTTKDIRNYVREHYGEITKVEWIDDTSANLIIGSNVEAKTVLAALASLDIEANPTSSPEDLYPAKSFSEKPDVTLSVRLSLLTDKKEAGAAQRSRFYLLNPEYDPEERARRREAHDQRRHRDNRGGDRYQRRDRYARDDPDKIETYPDSFYDDDVDSSSKQRRRSSRSRSPAQNHGRELFPDKSAGGGRRGRFSGLDVLRSRSASPGRRSGGDQSARPVRERDMDRERFIKEQQRLNNRSKELFPVKSLIKEASESGRLNNRSHHEDATKDRQYTGFAIKGASQSVSVKELFPSRFSSNANKELFAEKLQGRDRRRQRADDNW